jgi:hypothetical protein
VATKTIREAEAAWLMTAGLSGSTARVPALYGGYLVATSAQTFKLVRYSIAHGVAVSGTVKITSAGPPVVFQGSLTISGAGAATGVLGLQHGVLRGALGGRLFG